MIWKERITMDPEILAGKPIVRGTRLAVDHVVSLLAEGWTAESLLAEYPQLSGQDVQACLAYAAEILGQESRFPLKG
ncbi:MAG: DUF433 domain-containing protein [Phycisphaerae bacterium]